MEVLRHHHKYQGLDPLIRSVSRVTAARANASSVFQLFYFLVVCSGMISKGFAFVQVILKFLFYGLPKEVPLSHFHSVLREVEMDVQLSLPFLE